MRSKRQSSGFTLVEVLIVVTIMALAAAIVVPRMTQAGQMQIQAAGRMIIADLLIAQNDAISHQATRRVVFDTATNRYWLADGTGSTAGVVWKRDGSIVSSGAVDLDEDGRFDGVTLVAANFNGQSYVEFDALGTPTEGGIIDIRSGDVSYRISVAPLTGRIAIAPIDD